MNKCGRKKYKNVHLGKKNNTRKLNVTAKTCIGRQIVKVKISAIRLRLSVHWNKREGALWARPHLTKLICEKQPKGSSAPRKQKQTKA